MTNHQNIALSRKQMSSDLSDEELILQVQEGNRNAFDVLVHRFKDRIYHFILKMVKDPELAEEIAQDAFVRAYINADKYRTIARFSTWLYTIALNLVRNHMRKQKRSIVSRIPLLYSRDSVPVEKEYQDSAPLPDHQVQNRELRERVGGILERISPHYLEPLLLREYGDMTYEEISAATGLKIGTVRSRINRARNQFATIWKKEYGNSDECILNDIRID